MKIDDSSRKINRIDPHSTFIELCEARAMMFSYGVYTLREYSDYLQAWAVDHELVKAIGQDAVQRIMADAILPYRRDLHDDE